MLVDSHCHLNYPKLVERQAEVLASARAAGVTTMLNISTRESEWADIVATAEREPHVWASIGIHPHEADTHPDVDTAKLVAAAAHPRVVAIGETGLDYYYDHSDRDRQQASFRAHIAAARETGLPLIIHTRDAEADTHAILAEEKARGDFPALIHCFTASADFADKVLALGAEHLDLGHRHLQKRQGSAGHRRDDSCRPAADREPTRLSSRPSRIAAAHANPPSSPTPRVFSPRCAASRSKS